MDIRRYYRELRELEAQIKEKDIFVTSLETPDGGRAGQVAEVAKRTACKLLVEGRARKSTPAEIEAYKREQAARRATAEKERLAEQVRFHLVTDGPRGTTVELKPRRG
jgi:hypothetical protein